jgi:NAD(P)-dependent dehydrogenase (short-subunit alcohol dehydrogenase family)
MNTQSPVVLVTGGNRGIGLEICRQLLARSARVLLTARSLTKAQAAAKSLNAGENQLRFHPLDVVDEKSIEALRAFVAATYGRLDVLINNAGIIAKTDRNVLELPLAAVRETLETNTLGPLRLAQALTPIMRVGGAGRIINMSSGMGALSSMGSDHAAYRMSKTALNALTLMLATELSSDGIAVNSMCPGWVRTDMGGPGASRDVSTGADTAVWLALDAPQTLTGKFLRDRKVIPW